MVKLTLVLKIVPILIDKFVVHMTSLEVIQYSLFIIIICKFVFVAV